MAVRPAAPRRSRRPGVRDHLPRSDAPLRLSRRYSETVWEVRMDRTTLRETQAPLKQRYRDEPSSALTPLHATATFDDPGITCTVQTWAGPIRAGLHPATGGGGSDACSGDLLLQALLACAGVTLRSVATALGIDVRSATLRVRGQFDARGTLRSEE